MLPVNSTSKDLFKLVTTELNLLDGSFSDPMLLLKGKELSAESDLSLEQLGLQPHTKLLITASIQMSSFTAHRFKDGQYGWGYGNTIDAISFSVSRDLYVVGFGIYRPFSESVGRLKVRASFYDGPGSGSDSPIIFQKDIFVDFNPLCKEDETCSKEPAIIHRFIFERPCKIKAFCSYTCAVQIEEGSSFYGETGQAVITTENGVDFKFTASTCSKNGTCVEYGQIPEIYYYF